MFIGSYLIFCLMNVSLGIFERVRSIYKIYTCTEIYEYNKTKGYYRKSKMNIYLCVGLKYLCYQYVYIELIHGCSIANSTCLS